MCLCVDKQSSPIHTSLMSYSKIELLAEKEYPFDPVRAIKIQNRETTLRMWGSFEKVNTY